MSKTESSNSISLIFSQSSLQKLKNRQSEAFSKYKKSSQFIISFFVSSEADMTEQNQNRANEDIQDMIQTIIREMMSKIIQQNVAATTNITTAQRSNSSQQSVNQFQITLRATSESRSNC